MSAALTARAVAPALELLRLASAEPDPTRAAALVAGATALLEAVARVREPRTDGVHLTPGSGPGSVHQASPHRSGDITRE